MASRAYQKLGELLGSKGIAFATDDIRVLLVTSTYTFVITHEFVSDITNELVGAGYARSGAVGTPTFTWNSGQERWEFKHAATTHGNVAVGETIGAAILFLQTGSDATASLLWFDELTGNIPTTGAKVTYNPPANGHQIIHN